MRKKDYRVVEFTSNYQTQEKSKGLFHRWKKIVNEDGSEDYIAVIENLLSGHIVENKQKDIRFLTDKESVDFWSDADNAQIW